jgi:hypothetical protein
MGYCQIVTRNNLESLVEALEQRIALHSSSVHESTFSPSATQFEDRLLLGIDPYMLGASQKNGLFGLEKSIQSSGKAGYYHVWQAAKCDFAWKSDAPVSSPLAKMESGTTVGHVQIVIEHF